jgi:hypothetical protein
MATLEITTSITEEILDFLASAPSAAEILAFKISDDLDYRLHELLDKNSEGNLTAEEHTELDEFLQMGDFFSSLKIRVALKQAGKA